MADKRESFLHADFLDSVSLHSELMQIPRYSDKNNQSLLLLSKSAKDLPKNYFPCGKWRKSNRENAKYEKNYIQILSRYGIIIYELYGDRDAVFIALTKLQKYF